MEESKLQVEEKHIDEKILSNYAFTLKNIKNNIFRLGRNEDGDIIYLLNEGAIPSKLQLTTDLVYGKTIQEIFGKEKSVEVIEYFERAFHGEIVQYKVESDELWFETILSPIEINGEIVEVAGSSYDITERILYQREIESLNAELRLVSSTDKLTGLYNRFKLDEMLKYEILQSKRYNKGLSVIFFDIDHFKLVNDQHGHTAGDAVLKEMSDVCKVLIRDTDTFGRWGGEEFLVICPRTSVEQSLIIAERIRKTIDSNVFTPELSVTASFGVGGLELDMGFDALMKSVDGAMYEAKSKGRNTVVAAMKEIKTEDENVMA